MSFFLHFTAGQAWVQNQNFFFKDLWSQLFVALILGVGAVILVFAHFYFVDRSKFRAFLFGFLPFTAAMLGVVTLNHWLHLFLCWEATSLLSYYLISFDNEKAQARKGALHAALITGVGGLCLLTAILILGFQHNLWTISETINASWGTLPEASLLGWLIVVAALTKSAQFPFHFWLAGAMSAPTPASAFLHSATMVKAGIFLLARLHNGFEHLLLASQVLIVAGAITFLWGSFRSIFQNDLKGVLASTTIANLGVMTALLGLWGETGDGEIEIVLMGWILAHALYKAALFLYAGVVQEKSCTRKLSELAQIKLEGKRVRLLGYMLAGASLGLPFTLAYIPKAALALGWPFKLMLLIGLLFLGAAGLLVSILPLIQTQKSGRPTVSCGDLHHGLLISPAILAVASYFLPWAKFIGLPLPSWFEQMNSGGPSFDLNLASSFLLLLAGIAILVSWRPSWLAVTERLEPWRGARLFQGLINALLTKVDVVFSHLHSGSLRFYIGWLWLVMTLGVAVVLWSSPSALSSVWQLEQLSASWWLPIISIVTLVGALLVIKSRRPIESVIALGLVGYVLAGVFAYLGAPDVALTQLAVENISVIVLALVIRGMSNYPREIGGWAKSARIFISIFCGITVGLAVIFAGSNPSQSHLRDFFSHTSWNTAFGRNVVNVILVDFRALDTLAEITVVGLAAFMAHTLLRLTRNR